MTLRTHQILSVFPPLCQKLQNAHNNLVNFMKDKARVKTLGRDGHSKLQADLRRAAAVLLVLSIDREVTHFENVMSLMLFCFWFRYV